MVEIKQCLVNLKLEVNLQMQTCLGPGKCPCSDFRGEIVHICMQWDRKQFPDYKL